MGRIGHNISTMLEKAHMVRLTAPNGTDLTFELDRRPVHIDDGMIDKKDVAKGSFDATLPAGSVLIAIVGTSGSGKVIFDQPVRQMGLSILGMEWKFKDGKLTSMTAKKNLEPMSSNSKMLQETRTK